MTSPATPALTPAEYLNKLAGAVQNLTAPGQMFSVGRESIGGVDYAVYKSAPASLRDYYGFALQFKDKEFLVMGDTRLTFGQVYAQAATVAHGLVREHGIGKGDRVAIAMRNNIEWCIAFMAITALGAVAVPMNGWWTAEELIYGLKDAEARLLIADQPRVDRLAAHAGAFAIPTVLVGAQSDQCFAWQSLLLTPATHFPEVSLAPDDPATLFYTSGSTGYPKGALSTQRGVISAIMSWALMSVAAASAGLGQDLTDTSQPLAALLTVPLFHVTGSHSVFLLSIAAGRKVVLMHKWDADEAARLIERERITYFTGVPTMSWELVKSPVFTSADTSSLVEVYAGGAARPKSHAEDLLSQNLSAGAAYGLTETNGLGCVITGDLYAAHPTAVGAVTPAVTEIRIVDEQGNDLPAGSPGEILIKSPANVVGYWNKPDATQAAFSDGWFRTGDVGVLDERGLLSIVDRIKDIIVRGGENISCLEVESRIYEFSGVLEVAVFGVACERLGERVGAVVYSADAEISVPALQQFLSERMAAFKVPEFIHVQQEPLPRTATGKIHKLALRQTTFQAQAEEATV